MKLSEVLAAAVMVAAFGATAQTTTPVKKPAPAKTARKTSAKKTVSKGAVKSRALVAGPARQAAPSSDRYKEIQDALASKGYLKTSPTGVWDPDSVDAMKRYQADQKLDPTGKVNARSLITLGLGPKNESLPSVVAPSVTPNK